MSPLLIHIKSLTVLVMTLYSMGRFMREPTVHTVLTLSRGFSLLPLFTKSGNLTVHLYSERVLQQRAHLTTFKYD